MVPIESSFSVDSKNGIDFNRYISGNIISFFGNKILTNKMKNLCIQFDHYQEIKLIETLNNLELLSKEYCTEYFIFNIPQINNERSYKEIGEYTYPFTEHNKKIIQKMFFSLSSKSFEKNINGTYDYSYFSGMGIYLFFNEMSEIKDIAYYSHKKSYNDKYYEINMKEAHVKLANKIKKNDISNYCQILINHHKNMSIRHNLCNYYKYHKKIYEHNERDQDNEYFHTYYDDEVEKHVSEEKNKKIVIII